MYRNISLFRETLQDIPLQSSRTGVRMRSRVVLAAALVCVSVGAIAAPNGAPLPAPVPAATRTPEFGTLLRAGALFRSLKLCGGAVAPDDKRVLGDILLAGSVNPDLAAPLPADAKVVSDIRSPSKELRERVQTSLNYYQEVVTTIQMKFDMEGRNSVCTPDLVPGIKAFADSAKASDVAANAKRVADLMVKNRCPGLGACK